MGAGRVVVSAENRSDGTPSRRFPTLLLLEVKTAGLSDGKLLVQNDFEDLLGDIARVSRTETLKLAGGGGRTLAVVTPVDSAVTAAYAKMLKETKSLQLEDQIVAAEKARAALGADDKDRRGDWDYLLVLLKDKVKLLRVAEAKAKGEAVDAEKRRKEEAAGQDAYAKEEEARRITKAKAAAEAERKDRERIAGSMLKYARELADGGMTDKAGEKLRDIIKGFPNTEAAASAKQLLEKLGK